MDIFDKMQTLPPDVALFVASLFVVCFTLVLNQQKGIQYKSRQKKKEKL